MTLFANRSSFDPESAAFDGSIEEWCLSFLKTDDPELKLAPPQPPNIENPGKWLTPPPPPIDQEPKRPSAWHIQARSPRTPREGAFVRAEARAQLFHTFCHHELQAAELFAWGVLRFPETPRAFRAGLIGLCQSELEHLSLYREHLERLGVKFGDQGIRDWFWQRVRTCSTPQSFVALVGLGLEGANLEHSARFARSFRNAGDHEGARILEQVERAEVGHVAFAVRWFEHFQGAPLDFDRWQACLPDPLTPSTFRGKPLNRKARLRAGMNAEFLQRLEETRSDAERIAHPKASKP